MLHLYDPAGATTAHDQGKSASAEQPNPHAAGSFYAYCWQAGQSQDERPVDDLHCNWTKLRAMDEDMPGWRDMRHENGSPMFTANGTMLDDRGQRSVFDDVDE